MAVEYMVTRDEIGLQTACEVLLHVPIRILEPAPKAISATYIVVYRGLSNLTPGRLTRGLR